MSTKKKQRIFVSLFVPIQIWLDKKKNKTTITMTMTMTKK